MPSGEVERWLAALDERHLSDLTLPEVSRALRALSSCYVERREKLTTGAALDGAGKRAAFALFYGPQHFFVARETTRRLQEDASLPAVRRILDLGCGTGTAGAAVAVETGASILGYDLNRWAVAEANWTYQHLSLRGRAQVMNVRGVRIEGGAGTLVLAAYAVNELPAEVRDDLLHRLLAAQARGSALLVIEPIGRRANPWWTPWEAVVRERGGRADDWRFRLTLPPRQRLLAKSAGLDVQELTARSLYVPGAGTIGST